MKLFREELQSRCLSALPCQLEFAKSKNSRYECMNVYDVETSSDHPEDADAFDTSRQARGLFTTGSQGAPTDFETIENVSDAKISELINQVKNFHSDFTMKPSIGIFDDEFIMFCDGETVEVIGTTRIADDIRRIISNPDSGYSHFADLESKFFDPVEYIAGSSSYWIVDIEEYSEEALEEAKKRISQGREKS